MNSRRRRGRPTLALWTLIAVADATLLAAAADPRVVLTVLGSILIVAVATAGAWQRRTAPARRATHI